jgi:hypothetical protein
MCFFTGPLSLWQDSVKVKGKGHPITGHQGPRGGVEL